MPALEFAHFVKLVYSEYRLSKQVAVVDGFSD